MTSMLRLALTRTCPCARAPCGRPRPHLEFRCVVVAAAARGLETTSMAFATAAITCVESIPTRQVVGIGIGVGNPAAKCFLEATLIDYDLVDGHRSSLAAAVRLVSSNFGFLAAW